MIILLFVNSIVVMNANMAWDPAKTYSFLILKYHDVFAKYFVFVEFWMKFDLRPVELRVNRKKITN